MGWKSMLGGLALVLAVTAGCKQRVFLTDKAFNEYQQWIPPHLLENPNVDSQPTIPPTGAPPTLYDLDRQIRYLSLAEAVSISLEQGTVGQPSLLFPGIGLDNLIAAPQGSAPSGSDSIRVLAMDPATTGSNIDASLAKFDAVWGTTAQWVNTDQPIATALQNIQAGGTSTGLNAIVQQAAQVQTGLYKPLPTGGVAGITFTTPYTFTNLPARVNPAYQPVMQFQFEQPLLQGFGVEINQLRTFHPGSINPALPTGNQTAAYLAQAYNPNTGVGLGFPPGILIARIRFNQNRAEFERNVNQMLLNVETAYWNLYGSYWQVYSREQGLRFAYESWKIVGAKFRAGRANRAEYAQARGQYELFRSQRLQAIDTLLDNERQLRAIMGLQIEDGTHLVPSDQPTLAEFRPDWREALATALSARPELYMARQDVKVQQLNVQLARNFLLPDLRFYASYDANAIGTTLTGPSQANAYRNLASNTFNDWSVGLRFTVPIGFRFAHAQLRQGQLLLARSYLVLQDQEMKAERFLGLEFRRMSSGYAQIKAARAQREAFGEQLAVRFEAYRAGRDTLDLLLEAQRFWADALYTEYQAVVTYNNALCAFEYAKGTILQHDNVTIAEGPIPLAGMQRAVEHTRERNKALILRERAAATGTLAAPPAPAGPINLVPQINAQSLPSFWKDIRPLKEADPLPSEPRPDAMPQAGGPPVGPVETTLDDIFPPSELPAPVGPASRAGPEAAVPLGSRDLPGAAPLSSPYLPAAPSRKPAVRRPSDFGALRPPNEGPQAPVAGPATPTILPLPANPQSGP